MSQVLLIGLGGFLGTISRYGLAGLCQRLAFGEGKLFPYGTLAVNVLGCLFLGLIIQLSEERFLMRPEIRLALTIGFLGGFTTFSTFGYETFALWNDGDWRRAALNFVLTNGLGLLAVWMGYRLGAGKLI
jgi:CrcB protein